MRLPDELIDRIRNSVDISDVISDHVALTRKGRSFVGLCPFHDDRKPSMNVAPDKQIYKCFACGAGGNVFVFLMEIEKISFMEAVQRLAERAGIALPKTGGEEVQKETSEVLYRASQLAADYYRHLLTKDPRGEGAKAYLSRRGVSEAIAERFVLGCAPPDWDGLLRVGAKRSLDPATLERAGLALPRKSGEGHYDRFRDRLMFPIVGATGRTVAFGARALKEGEEPKYLNSPETPIYHKGAVLYGLWQGKDAVRRRGTVVIVEGYMDLLRLAEAGVEHAVATAGTALTPDHTRLLRRFCDRAVLVFDGDVAGSAAALRGIDVLLEGDLSARVVALPEGHDPDSFVRERGGDAFLRLVEQAEPVLDYKLRALGAQEDLRTPDGKVRAVAALAETTARVRDDIRRGVLVREIAERLGVAEQVVAQAVKKAGGARREAGGQKSRGAEGLEEPSLNHGPDWERRLVGMALADDRTADRVRSEVSPEDFSHAVYRRIFTMIVSARSEGRSARAASLVTMGEDASLAGLISELSMEGFDESKADRVLKGQIQSLRRASVQRQLAEVEGTMRQAQQEGRSDALMDLLARHRRLTEALQGIKSVGLIEEKK
ncbi:MAG: DNA primase [Candidatus Latescibacteria bacterium]|nr:DNA primase [Candidatus Latescibacterota bacterium]